MVQIVQKYAFTYNSEIKFNSKYLFSIVVIDTMGTLNPKLISNYTVVFMQGIVRLYTIYTSLGRYSNSRQFLKVRLLKITTLTNRPADRVTSVLVVFYGS